LKRRLSKEATKRRQLDDQELCEGERVDGKQRNANGGNGSKMADPGSGCAAKEKQKKAKKLPCKRENKQMVGSKGTQKGAESLQKKSKKDQV